MASAPLYISGDEAGRLLDRDEVLRVIEQALVALAERRIVNGAKGGFSLNDRDGQRHMGAISGCDVAAGIAGVKWFAACDDNGRRGLPRVPATLLLCDAATGILSGIIDATSLTAVRTAALAIAAIRPCIGPPLQKAVIVGFGPIGQTIAHYMLANIATREVVIASNSRAAAEFVEAAKGVTGTCLHANGRLDEAVRSADLVITATGLSANTPLVKAAWLAPGATVCALGSYQEIDDEIVSGADRIFVDNWDAARQRGNLAPLIATGALAPERIKGTVADIVAGKVIGRSSADQKVLIVLVGVGALDIALGAALLKQARLHGVGQPLG